MKPRGRLIKEEVYENMHGPWYPSYKIAWYQDGDFLGRYCFSYGSWSLLDGWSK